MFLRLGVKMSDPYLEQRINITFCVKLEKSAAEVITGGETW